MPCTGLRWQSLSIQAISSSGSLPRRMSTTAFSALLPERYPDTQDPCTSCWAFFWRVDPLAAGKVTWADDELCLLLLRLRRRHRHGKRQHGKSQLLVHGALSSCVQAHRPFQAIQLHLSSWILDRGVSPHIILAFFLAVRAFPD